MLADPAVAAIEQTRRPGHDGFIGEKTAQVVSECLGAGVALARLLLQALQADGFEIARHAGVALPWRDRIAFHHLQKRIQRGRSLERRRAGEALIEDGAQSVDIACRADIARPGGLLGSHVAGRAQDRPGARFAAPSSVTPLAIRSQAEVGDLWTAVLAQKDIARLEVAVDDALLMGRVHGQRQRLHQQGRFARGTVIGQFAGQAAARAELEREIRTGCSTAEVHLADLMDLYDAGVLQAGECLGFQSKSIDLAKRAGEDHLECHLTAQFDVSGAIHNSHAAASQLGKDFVAGDERILSRLDRIGRSGRANGLVWIFRNGQPRQAIRGRSQQGIKSEAFADGSGVVGKAAGVLLDIGCFAAPLEQHRFDMNEVGQGFVRGHLGVPLQEVADPVATVPGTQLISQDQGQEFLT